MTGPGDGPAIGGPGEPANPLVVALDRPSLEEAEALARRIGDAAGALKVGLELFAAAGPAAAAAFDRPVFLDLKLHDIPTTVARALRALRPAPWAVSVHALGGRAMLEAAAEARPAGTRLLAVTILTHLADAELAELGLPPAAEAVPRLAALAASAGCDGVVCAPADLEAVRGVTPEGFLRVTPGIRPPEAAADEHARAGAPAEALAHGATHLVVGRPVTRAADPRAAAFALLDALGARR
jgi:orotidine-5'-phosphate decarboxylase